MLTRRGFIGSALSLLVGRKSIARAATKARRLGPSLLYAGMDMDSAGGFIIPAEFTAAILERSRDNFVITGRATTIFFPEPGMSIKEIGGL